MKYHELDVPAKKSRKRVGRGTGSGHGKTAGRGTKGQNARSGGGVRPGFEGGQNPLMKRIPKVRGFKSNNRTKVETVHTDQLNSFRAKSTITKEMLKEARVISSTNSRVKLLKRGPVEKEFTIELDAVSKSAAALIEDAGGSVKVKA